MTHKLRGVRVDAYAYYVNKLRPTVGLETCTWRHIVTLQTTHTKYKWPPYASEWNPPLWKFSVYATAWSPQLIPIDLILVMTVYLPEWHSHCTKASFTVLVLCSDELQSTHVGSFACWGRLRNLRGDRSAVSLYCVIITWQRIFKCSLQVTIQ